MTILEKEFVELKGYFRTFFERKTVLFGLSTYDMLHIQKKKFRVKRLHET